MSTGLRTNCASILQIIRQCSWDGDANAFTLSSNSRLYLKSCKVTVTFRVCTTRFYYVTAEIIETKGIIINSLNDLYMKLRYTRIHRKSERFSIF